MQKVITQNNRTGWIRKNEDGTQTYISYRNRTKHYFIKYEGYGISLEVLKLLKDSNIENIIIIEEYNEEGDKRKLLTEVEEYFKYGTYYKHINEDYQLILPIIRFKTE